MRPLRAWSSGRLLLAVVGWLVGLPVLAIAGVLALAIALPPSGPDGVQHGVDVLWLLQPGWLLLPYVLPPLVLTGLCWSAVRSRAVGGAEPR